jgi:sorting nexin-1/2
VEERRYQLELFLRRVAVHPELYDAACLVQFLRADDATFYAAKNNKSGSGQGGAGEGVQQIGGGAYYDDYRPTEERGVGVAASPNKKKKDGIKQWFAETKTSIQISTLGGVDLVQSPDDALFEEMDRYVSNLDSQMKHVLSQATSLVRRGKELANGFYELGMAFNLLSQSESCGSSSGVAATSSNSAEAMDFLATALSKMGVTSDELSAITAEQSEKEEQNFEAMLRDYIRTIQSVKRALEKRSEKRLTYTTCIKEVQTKTMAVEKLRGVPGKEDKAYQAQASMMRSQEAAEVARDEFATVSQRILREMDRFKREKADDIRCTVLDYIELQIQYNARMETIWGDLIPQLEDLSTKSDVAAAASTTAASTPTTGAE